MSFRIPTFLLGEKSFTKIFFRDYHVVCHQLTNGDGLFRMTSLEEFSIF
ncbi:MAG: hypothetical protein IPH62_18550 [Ignavibacteriae bacterium]|nr:hypothetical protein [Ignavibacteriota bacterium]